MIPDALALVQVLQTQTAWIVYKTRCTFQVCASAQTVGTPLRTVAYIVLNVVLRVRDAMELPPVIELNVWITRLVQKLEYASAIQTGKRFLTVQLLSRSHAT